MRGVFFNKVCIIFYNKQFFNDFWDILVFTLTCHRHIHIDMCIEHNHNVNKKIETFNKYVRNSV